MSQLKMFDVGKLSDFEPFDIAAELKEQMAKAVEDCQRRPGDKKVRKVILQIELSPLTDNTGEVTKCQMAFQCTAKLPSRKTGSLLVGVKKNGALTYAPEQAEED